MIKSQEVKGAVMLLGSLYWEGNEALRDGEKGELRKKWREDHLHMHTCRDIRVPIRYGRRSKSRNWQFTIVLGGGKKGVAKMANLKRSLPAEGDRLGPTAVKILQEEVQALAEAEAVWNDTNRQHSASWGLVSIAINPKSKFKEELRKLWKERFRPGNSFAASDYDEGVVNSDGILEVSLAKAAWNELDFCLATPTKPDHPAPAPKEIAHAMKLVSYFFRCKESGIRTPEDGEIKAQLLRGPK